MDKKTTTKKTTEKKPVKTVTMADLKRQQDRIETVLCKMDEFLREATDKAVMRIDHRTREDGNSIKELIDRAKCTHALQTSDHDDIVHRILPALNRIERLLSTPQDVTSGTVTFNPIIPEQGLEPGDYTSGTPEELKEVADALTAMGWGWVNDQRPDARYIWRSIGNEDKMYMAFVPALNTLLPQAEFLSRAAVTAKALGLVAVVKEEPWPQGTLFVHGSGEDVHRVRYEKDGRVHSCDGFRAFDKINCRKLSPEEVAKYHADLEAAKPIVPYVTRVRLEGKEWTVLYGPDASGHYQIHNVHKGTCDTAWVERHEFTVIP